MCETMDIFTLYNTSKLIIVSDTQFYRLCTAQSQLNLMIVGNA